METEELELDVRRHVAAVSWVMFVSTGRFTVCAAASLQSASVPIGTADPNLGTRSA